MSAPRRSPVVPQPPAQSAAGGGTPAVRSVSFGGGVQSTCLLVLAAKRAIDFKTFLFANVGDDSEHPATLRDVHDVTMPYAASHGIDLLELHRIPTKGVAKGQIETLWGRLTRPGSRSLPIPVRMSNGAPGRRSCTADFKVRVVGAELRRRGATVENPATVALGISVDDRSMARRESAAAWRARGKRVQRMSAASRPTARWSTR